MYIHIEVQDTKLAQMIQEALEENCDGLIFTTFKKAELVICEDDGTLPHMYDPDTRFAMLFRSKYLMHDLPENVFAIPAEKFLGKMLEVIFKVKNKSFFVEVMDGVYEVEGKGEINILVVDPDMVVRDDAKQDLFDSADKLILAGRFADAVEQIRSQKLDVVLTSLYLDASPDYAPYVPSYEEMRMPVPYGFLLAMEAAKNSIATSIVCDSEMKTDPLVAAMFHLGPYFYHGSPIAFWTRGKQWRRAMNALLNPAE
ncbi:hypothetical protein GF391_04170 [Candidatus Uhrbacteria bacterium]|nr:hypothetical protein [Candidatus Uhrbacteria bacterium]